MDEVLVRNIPPPNPNVRSSWPFTGIDTSRVERYDLGVWTPVASLADIKQGDTFRLMEANGDPTIHLDMSYHHDVTPGNECPCENVAYSEVRAWWAVTDGATDDDGPFVNCEPSTAFCTLAE